MIMIFLMVQETCHNFLRHPYSIYIYIYKHYNRYNPRGKKQWAVLKFDCGNLGSRGT